MPSSSDISFRSVALVSRNLTIASSVQEEKDMPNA